MWINQCQRVSESIRHGGPRVDILVGQGIDQPIIVVEESDLFRSVIKAEFEIPDKGSDVGLEVCPELNRILTMTRKPYGEMTDRSGMTKS